MSLQIILPECCHIPRDFLDKISLHSSRNKRLLMSPFMKMISAFSILFRGLYTHDFFAAQYKRARNMTWRLYQPCVIVVNTLVSNLKPFTWFFNKWKQIEIIKIHAESHEHKQSFIKWIGFKNFLWQIEVLLTQVKSSVC